VRTYALGILMSRDLLEKLWRAYESDLRAYNYRLDSLCYSPSWYEHPKFEVVGDLEEKVFLLPRKITFHSIEKLINPPLPPDIPALPSEPYPPKNGAVFLEGLTGEIASGARLMAVKLQKKRSEIERHFSQSYADACKRMASLQSLFANSVEPTTSINEQVLVLADQETYFPEYLRSEVIFRVDKERGVLLIQFKFPDYSRVPIVLDDNHRRIKVLPKTRRKDFFKRCLYSMIIRYAYLGAKYRLGALYQSVAINVYQDWNDSATGNSRTGAIASLLARSEELETLDLEHLDPVACFKHFKGIAVQSFEVLSPIRPVFILDRNDERIVEGKAVDQDLDEGFNIAAMSWEDFEHLVAQLFEWEFSKDGVEVNVTRASRDRGVDAILFDPDPLRGGKYVLQAKRYTRTVDVSAVRDLYGTVMNEGANRGILITTASFGPDAYEFIKDKPLSLVDGPNLLQMLLRHGRKFRIDLEEARSLNGEK
jgi:restriction system protein